MSARAFFIGAGVLAGVAAAMAYVRGLGAVESAPGEESQETDAAGFDFNIYSQVQDLIAPTNPDQAEANTAAFLAMIRVAEGTAGENGYRTLFGGRLFDDLSDHPRRAKAFTNRAGQTLYTTAAGAYQMLAISPLPGGGFTRVNTWDRIAAKLGLPDFGPESQDRAAVELIRQAGALGDVRAGRFDAAVNKVRGVWASMPGAGYSQPERSIESLRAAYSNSGGQFA